MARHKTFLLLALLFLIKTSYGDNLNEIMQKTDQFFDQLLHEHPSLNLDVSSDELDLINKEINNYETFIKRSYDLTDQKTSRPKRDLEMSTLIRDPVGTYVLEKIIASTPLQAKFPKDINLFTFKNKYYAAVLESNNPVKQHGDALVLYIYQDDSYIEKCRIPVNSGTTVEVHNMDGNVYITSAENNSTGITNSPYNGLILYKLVFVDGKPSLERAQTLNTVYMNSLIIWEFYDETYMAVSDAKQLEDKESSNHQTLIYKWAGKNFDLFQKLNTLNAQSVAPFNIGNFMFIAVANYGSKYGETDIDSEIYKFDVDQDQFVVYQKLKTHAAKDIKYFNLKELTTDTMEHFLIVANNHGSDLQNKPDYQTESIVYKFVNDSFIPFQSFKLHAPTHWLPLQGANQEFLLLVSCEYHGIRAFQYNGWRFSEVCLNLRSGSFGPGVINMRYHNMNDKTVLALTNKKTFGDDDHIFELKFTKRNDLASKLSEYEGWCQHEQTLLQTDLELEMLEKELDQAIVNYPDGVGEHDELILDNASIDELITQEFGMYNQELVLLLNRMADDLAKLELQCLADSALIEQAVANRANILSTGTFRIPYLEVKCVTEELCTFAEIRALNLNNRNLFTFLDNMICLNSEMMDSLLFDDVVVNNQLNSLFVNDHPAAALLDKKTEYLVNKNLIVHGNVRFEKDLNVTGLVDGVKFNSDSLLLNNQDQVFDGKLLVEKAVIDNIRVKGSFNGLNITEWYEGLSKKPMVTDGKLDKLEVNNLQVDGLISGFNFTDVYNNALRKTGPQVITEKHTYEFISVDNVVVDNNMVKNVDLSKMISVDGVGGYTVSGHWTIQQPSLTIDQLKVRGTLNNIPARTEDERLNFLVHDSTQPQYVTGGKTVTNVNVLKNFTSSKISASDVGVKIVSDDIILSPSFVSSVKVEGDLFVNDIKDENSDYFLSRIIKHGLRLDEDEIDQPVVFNSPISVDNLYCNTLNGITPASWVQQTGERQVVTGRKIFKSNVTLGGKTKLRYFNNVDVPKMFDDAFMVTGEQNITGRKSVKSVTVDRLKADKITLNGRQWSDIVKITPNEALPIIVSIQGSLTTNQLQTDTVSVRGLFNNMGWNEFINDTVFADKVYDVDGVKSLDVMYGSRLVVDGLVNGVSLEDWVKLAEDSNKQTGVVYGSVVVLDKPLAVDQLEYEGTLDGVPHTKFEETYLLSEGDQNITTPIVFNNVMFENGVRVTSDTVNNINITNLYQDTYKTDQDESLGHVIFQDEVDVRKTINLKQKLNGVKLEDEVVVKNSDVVQDIFSFKLFEHDLIINGNLHVDGSMSGVNMSYLCSNDEHSLPNILVKGSVYFEHEPRITGLINGLELQELNNKEIWLKNKPVSLTGNIVFKNLTLTDQVTLTGLLNNMDLAYLERYYMSKTLGRVVTGEINFAGGLVIEKQPHIKQLQVNGLVNQINFDKLVNNVLLDGKEQTITARHKYFDVGINNNLVIDGKISGLSLDEDVLRYNSENATVTGKFNVRSLVVDELEIVNGTTLQGVDVEDWDKHGCKISQDCTVFGRLRLHNVTFFSGLKVDGLVNYHKFDKNHILLKSGFQNVTGRKTFSNIFVNSLKVNGKMNNIKLTDFMENLALNNRDLTFTNRKIFTQGLSVDNLYTNSSVFGVSIDDLFSTVSRLKPIELLEEKFEKLSKVAADVDKSFSSQAYFLDHYELLHEFDENIAALYPYKFANDADGKFVVVHSVDGATDFQSFVYDRNEFRLSKDMTSEKATLPFVPVFSHPLTLGEDHYVLYELMDGTGTYTSLVMKANKLITVSTNQTSCVSPLYMPNSDARCFFLGQKLAKSKVLCMISAEHDQLHTVQEFENNVIESASMERDGVSYLVVLTREDSKNKKEGNITVYHYDTDKDEFVVDQIIPVLNPLSLSAVHFRGDCFLAVASGNLPGSANNGFTTVYRYENRNKLFVKQQYLGEKAPVKLQFAVLPTSELVLYVLTTNPAQPFVVYRYRGVEAFTEFTKGFGLHLFTNIHTYTDSNLDHFVLTYGHGKGQILKAGFKGTPPY